MESGLKPFGKLQERESGFDFAEQPEAELSARPDSAGPLLCFPLGLWSANPEVRTLEQWPGPTTKKVLPQLAPDRTRIRCQSSDGRPMIKVTEEHRQRMDSPHK